MYKVMLLKPTYPGELAKWLNDYREEKGWELIAVDNGYYIFKVS